MIFNTDTFRVWRARPFDHSCLAEIHRNARAALRILLPLNQPDESYKVSLTRAQHSNLCRMMDRLDTYIVRSKVCRDIFLECKDRGLLYNRDSSLPWIAIENGISPIGLPTNSEFYYAYSYASVRNLRILRLIFSRLATAGYDFPPVPKRSPPLVLEIT